MLKEGQILEKKYKVGRLLGKGGMGAVFFGEHTLINRKVAIKVLFDVDPESENAQRFEKEAQAAGRIGSDHIVEVLDLGLTPEGERFMVMEYLDGESLKARFARGLMKPADLIPLCVQMLDGLSAAHAAGIVHRDLKPDNIFILKEKAGRRDFVKIVDFGISKFASVGTEGAVTKTGAVLGTPYYMSPEQARAANEVDNRSDLYSIGVIMYQAVTATVPFHGTTFTELLFKIVFETPPDPLTIAPNLDRSFAALIMRGMARDQSDRFPTAAAFKEALLSWREGTATSAGPSSTTGTLVFAPPTASTIAVAPSMASQAVTPMPFVSTAPPMGARTPPAWPQAPSGSTPSGPGFSPPSPQGLQLQSQFSQSVSAGSQTLDSIGQKAPPRRGGLFALLGGAAVAGAGVAVFVAMHRGAPSSPKAESTSAVATATNAATSMTAGAPTGAPTVAPVAATQSATAESVSPSASAPSSATTTAPVTVAQGQWPPPAIKPQAPAQPPPVQPPPVQPPPPVVPPPTPPGGKLKDLGY